MLTLPEVTFKTDLVCGSGSGSGAAGGPAPGRSSLQFDVSLSGLWSLVW